MNLVKFIYVPTHIFFTFFQPHDSEFVILDLGRRLDDIGLQIEKNNRYLAILFGMVVVIVGGGSAYPYHQAKANRKSSDEIKADLSQV